MKKYIIGFGLIGFVGLIFFEKRRKEMLNNKETVEKIVKATEKPLYTKQIEIEEFTERMQALSRDEWEIVADLMPIDLCMKRIQDELDKAMELKNSVRGLVDRLGGGK